MPSKFDKATIILALIVLLPVAVGFLVLDVMSGLWKTDLIMLGFIVLFIIMSCCAFWIGRRLRGMIEPTKEMLHMLLQAGMVAIACDCILVFLAAFTVGYQPWLMFVLLPIFFLGVTCLVLAALLSGSMKDTSTTSNHS